jgi:hypothetical protein
MGDTYSSIIYLLAKGAKRAINVHCYMSVGGLPLPVRLYKPSDIERVRGALIRFQHSSYYVPARALPLLV